MVQLFVVDVLVFWGFGILTSYIPIYCNVFGDARTYHIEIMTEWGIGYVSCYLRCCFLTLFFGIINFFIVRVCGH